LPKIDSAAARANFIELFTQPFPKFPHYIIRNASGGFQMNKTITDKLILEYQKKIFGFALSKLQNLPEAEELASDITCEVYHSLLCADEIPNPEGYIYRIASNVFARFLQKKKQENHIDIMDVQIAFRDEYFDRMENNETISELRRGISLLSRQQRVIIYLYYYQKRKIKEIAAQLEISEGTVKWHLSDARTTLKEELIMNNINTDNTDNLTVNPIHFVSMGHNGRPGEKGDTADIFDTRLKQNIAWCCYHAGHTIEEIARLLGMPAVYIADEIQILEEYGFLDRVNSGKNPIFRTNMVITDGRMSSPVPENRLYQEAAEKFCDEFYPQIFADFEKSEDFWGFHCADNDVNFMKYNLVMLCASGIILNIENDNAYWEKYAVKRPDGGMYIAHANVSDDCQRDGEKNPYWACGYMRRDVYREGEEKLNSIQLDCAFCSRQFGWHDNRASDWDDIYTFISSHYDIQALSPEAYKRLCDKGYLLEDKLQLLYAEADKKDIREYFEKIIQEHVAVPKDIVFYGKEFDERMYRLKKEEYPVHIRPIIQYYHRNCLNHGKFVPYLIEEMLKRKMLFPLTETQKKSVFTVFAYI